MSSQRQDHTVLPQDWPEESQQRLAKARALQDAGVPPYPTRFERTHRLAEVAQLHGARSLEDLEDLKPPARIAGRVMLKRPHGKASFATLSDGSGELHGLYEPDDAGTPARITVWMRTAARRDVPRARGRRRGPARPEDAPRGPCSQLQASRPGRSRVQGYTLVIRAASRRLPPWEGRSS